MATNPFQSLTSGIEDFIKISKGVDTSEKLSHEDWLWGKQESLESAKEQRHCLIDRYEEAENKYWDNYDNNEIRLQYHIEMLEIEAKISGVNGIDERIADLSDKIAKGESIGEKIAHISKIDDALCDLDRKLNDPSLSDYEREHIKEEIAVLKEERITEQESLVEDKKDIGEAVDIGISVINFFRHPSFLGLLRIIDKIDRYLDDREQRETDMNVSVWEDYNASKIEWLENKIGEITEDVENLVDNDSLDAYVTTYEGLNEDIKELVNSSFGFIEDKDAYRELCDDIRENPDKIEKLLEDRLESIDKRLDDIKVELRDIDKEKDEISNRLYANANEGNGFVSGLYSPDSIHNIDDKEAKDEIYKLREDRNDLKYEKDEKGDYIKDKNGNRIERDMSPDERSTFNELRQSMDRKIEEAYIREGKITKEDLDKVKGEKERYNNLNKESGHIKWEAKNVIEQKDYINSGKYKELAIEIKGKATAVNFLEGIKLKIQGRTSEIKYIFKSLTKSYDKLEKHYTKLLNRADAANRIDIVNKIYGKIQGIQEKMYGAGNHIDAFKATQYEKVLGAYENAVKSIFPEFSISERIPVPPLPPPPSNSSSNTISEKPSGSEENKDTIAFKETEKTLTEKDKSDEEAERERLERESDRRDLEKEKEDRNKDKDRERIEREKEKDKEKSKDKLEKDREKSEKDKEKAEKDKEKAEKDKEKEQDKDKSEKDKEKSEDKKEKDSEKEKDNDKEKADKEKGSDKDKEKDSDKDKDNSDKKESDKDKSEDKKESDRDKSEDKKETDKEKSEDKKETDKEKSEDKKESDKDKSDDKKESDKDKSEDKKESDKDKSEDKRESDKDKSEDKREYDKDKSEDEKESDKDKSEDKKESDTEKSDDKKESDKDKSEDKKESDTEKSDDKKESDKEKLEDTKEADKGKSEDKKEKDKEEKFKEDSKEKDSDKDNKDKNEEKESDKEKENDKEKEADKDKESDKEKEESKEKDNEEQKDEEEPKEENEEDTEEEDDTEDEDEEDEDSEDEEESEGEKEDSDDKDDDTDEEDEKKSEKSSKKEDKESEERKSDSSPKGNASNDYSNIPRTQKNENSSFTDNADTGKSSIWNKEIDLSKPKQALGVAEKIKSYSHDPVVAGTNQAKSEIKSAITKDIAATTGLPQPVASLLSEVIVTGSIGLGIGLGLAIDDFLSGGDLFSSVDPSSIPEDTEFAKELEQNIKDMTEDSMTTSENDLNSPESDSELTTEGLKEKCDYNMSSDNYQKNIEDNGSATFEMDSPDADKESYISGDTEKEQEEVKNAELTEAQTAETEDTLQEDIVTPENNEYDQGWIEDWREFGHIISDENGIGVDFLEFLVDDEGWGFVDDICFGVTGFLEWLGVDDFFMDLHDNFCDFLHFTFDDGGLLDVALDLTDPLCTKEFIAPEIQKAKMPWSEQGFDAWKEEQDQKRQEEDSQRGIYEGQTFRDLERQQAEIRELEMQKQIQEQETNKEDSLDNREDKDKKDFDKRESDKEKTPMWKSDESRRDSDSHEAERDTQARPQFQQREPDYENDSSSTPDR